MAPTDTGSSKTVVTVKFTDQEKQRINQIAYELSEPGNNVTASDVLREAARDYMDKFDAQPDDCCPGDRGRLENGAEA